MVKTWLALTSVNYHRDVRVSILFNQWLAPTVLWATGQSSLISVSLHVYFSGSNRSVSHSCSSKARWKSHESSCSFQSDISNYRPNNHTSCRILLCSVPGVVSACYLQGYEECLAVEAQGLVTIEFDTVVRQRAVWGKWTCHVQCTAPTKAFGFKYQELNI